MWVLFHQNTDTDKLSCLLSISRSFFLPPPPLPPPFPIVIERLAQEQANTVEIHTRFECSLRALCAGECKSHVTHMYAFVTHMHAYVTQM